MRQGRKKFSSRFTQVKVSKQTTVKSLLQSLKIISVVLNRCFQDPPSTIDPGGGALCHYSPCITHVFVGKSQDICSSASALIDHDRDSWAGPHIFPHHQDHIWASFHHQPNYRYTLAHSCFKTHPTSYKQVLVTHTEEKKNQNIL